MNEEEYLEQRVDNQIGWYDSKGGRNKKMFNGLKIVEIIVALSIPLFVNFIPEELSSKFIVSFLGVIIAAIAGIISLMKYQENWLEYRTTAESLKHEKYLFVTKSGQYGDKQAFGRFVERIENLISKENSKWAEFIKTEAGDSGSAKEDS